MSVAEDSGKQANGWAQRAFASMAAALGFEDARRFGVELLIFAAVLVAAGTWGAFLLSHFEFTRLCHGFDLWFDSDPARTVSNITSRWAVFHERSVLHPLYSLLIAGPFAAVQDALGIPTSTLTAIYVALQSACFSGATYAALRCFGLVRLDAILGVLLLNSTASVIYWIGVPEWIAFGATSVLISIIWVAGPASIKNRATGIAQNFISGSIAATSWVIGAAASFVSDWPKLRWAQAFSHTRDAIALMAALTVVQYLIFPSAGGFLDFWGEAEYFLVALQVDRSFFQYIVEFFGQTLVAPVPGIGAEGPREVPGWGVLIMYSQLQGIPVTPLTLLILGLWLALGALGLRAAFKGAVKAASIVMVLGAIAYFFILHNVLGGELFLFTLHFAPLFVFVALWSLRSEWKWIARGLCAALIVASFAHNYPSFRSAIAMHNAIDLSWLERTGHYGQEAALQTDCR